MADKKISELNPADALTGVELAVAVQGGETMRTTYSAIKTYIGAEPADATILKEADVDDVPVDGATTAPISSNWAFDHNASTTAHSMGTAAQANTGDFATSAQGTTADTPISSRSDIGDNLADNDDLLVYDTSTTTHKKSALTRFWTYIGSKLNSYTGDLTAKSLSLNQNISQAAWTTTGVRHKNTAVTLTDTTSSGTVASAYTNVFGGNTIAATNTTTFTEYATTFLSAPIAGTNVTITKPLALKVSGAAMFSGAVLAQSVVTPITTTASPSSTDSRTVYTNEGDADGTVFTLPTAIAGPQYTFIVQTAQTMTITASAGDTIRIGSSVTAAAGSISSLVVGSVITLQAINATEWIAISVVGSWSI